MKKPDFIGIGAQKCATTWLYRMLSNHPQVSLAWPRERDRDKDIKFFNYFYDRGIEWYEHHFDNCQGDVIGEYSTTYFYNREAPERIYKYSPNIKLIVSLRHPVERAFSNHKFEIRLGRVSGDNTIFENALENNPMYLHQSRYFEHLSQWLQYFDQNQIYVILVDDLWHDSLQVLQGLYRFLNVSGDHIPAIHNQRVNETRITKIYLIELLIINTIKLARQARLGRLVDSLENTGVKSAMIKMSKKEESEALPPMRAETRRRLLDYFADDVDRLSTFLDRDLSAWRK